MYTIEVGYTHCRITPTLPAEIGSRINDSLRYHPSGYQHTWNFKNKKWDGYTYLFNVVDQTFRTGLLWRVSKIIVDASLTLQLNDARQQREIIPYLDQIDLDKIIPFEYQIAAVEALQESSSDGTNTHGIIASPTGTGKTIIMGLLVKKYKLRTLIVVNSRVLLDQTHEFFDEVVPDGAGIIGDGAFHLKDVTIATIQSLSSILGVGKKQKATSNARTLQEYLDSVGLVVHDEVHEADSNSVDGLYARLPANYFIGTTATPYAWAYASEKGKNLEMEQHFGRKIFDTRDIVDFIKLGITVPLHIIRPIAPQAEIYQGYDPSQTSIGEFRDTIDAQVINNSPRIEMIADRARHYVESGMSVYVYYNRIAYGEALCRAMGDMNPVMLQGSTSRTVRHKIFKEIESKKRLLVVSDIGSYGLNIRSLDVIIMAYPQKDARQLKGRVCRAYPGKKCGIVEDLVDFAPFLYRHAQIRANQYEKDGDIVVG